MKTPEEQIDDLDLEFAAFCGTDFGASVVAELGQEPVWLIWQAALQAQRSVYATEIERTILELKAKAA